MRLLCCSELSSLKKQTMPCEPVQIMGIACMEEELAFTVFLKPLWRGG